MRPVVPAREGGCEGVGYDNYVICNNYVLFYNYVMVVM